MNQLGRRFGLNHDVLLAWLLRTVCATRLVAEDDLAFETRNAEPNASSVQAGSGSKPSMQGQVEKQNETAGLEVRCDLPDACLHGLASAMKYFLEQTPDIKCEAAFQRAVEDDAGSSSLLGRCPDKAGIGKDAWKNSQYQICYEDITSYGRSQRWRTCSLANVTATTTKTNEADDKSKRLTQCALTSNAHLLGYGIASFNNVTVEKCMDACGQDLRCKSFNWNRDYFSCELNEKRAGERQALKNEEPGGPFDYYDCEALTHARLNDSKIDQQKEAPASSESGGPAGGKTDSHSLASRNSLSSQEGGYQAGDRDSPNPQATSSPEVTKIADELSQRLEQSEKKSEDSLKKAVGVEAEQVEKAAEQKMRNMADSATKVVMNAAMQAEAEAGKIQELIVKSADLADRVTTRLEEAEKKAERLERLAGVSPASEGSAITTKTEAAAKAAPASVSKPPVSAVQTADSVEASMAKEADILEMENAEMKALLAGAKAGKTEEKDLGGGRSLLDEGSSWEFNCFDSKYVFDEWSNEKQDWCCTHKGIACKIQADQSSRE